MTTSRLHIPLLILLVLAFAAVDATAQDRMTAAAPERRLSLEAAAGLQLDYRGSVQSVAVGFAPTRRLTIAVALERSHVADDIDYFEDGFASELGGTDRFVSGELRFAFLVDKRVSPYVLGGLGRGTSRSNVSDLFPEQRTRNMGVLYYGGGVRMPLHPRFDAFVDGRLMMGFESRSDYFAVRFPVRAGVAWRF